MSFLSLLADTHPVSAASPQPVCREVDWDFVQNCPRWQGGEPVYVTGARAVLVWAWNALHTNRFAHDVFSSAYGQDLQELVGRPYTAEVRDAEAIRIIRETLEVHPDIQDVTQISVQLTGSQLELSCRLMTSYGEVDYHDTV